MLKPLTVWIIINCGICVMWSGVPISHYLPPEIPVNKTKKQQLELDMEKQTGSKLGKEHVKAVYCHLHIVYLQSTSCEMLGWMNHKLELRLQEKYQQPQICRWYHFNGRKWRGTKETLDEGERGELKSWLKTQHSKTKIMAFSLSTLWEIDGETVTDFIFLGSKSLQMVTAAMKLKDACSFRKSYDKHRQRMKKQRYHFASKGPYSQSCGFFQ